MNLDETNIKNGLNSLGQSGSDQKYNIYPNRDFDLNNSASSTDLTGLFVRPPQSNAELESYKSIVDYQTKPSTENIKNVEL